MAAQLNVLRLSTELGSNALVVLLHVAFDSAQPLMVCMLHMPIIRTTGIVARRNTVYRQFSQSNVRYIACANMIRPKWLSLARNLRGRTKTPDLPLAVR